MLILFLRHMNQKLGSVFKVFFQVCFKKHCFQCSKSFNLFSVYLEFKLTTLCYMSDYINDARKIRLGPSFSKPKTKPRHCLGKYVNFISQAFQPKAEKPLLKFSSKFVLKNIFFRAVNHSICFQCT